MKNNCCFCGIEMTDFGNSTWPIFVEADGERNRCCDKCNQKYVITARVNPMAIMHIRNLFGINCANM